MLFDAMWHYFLLYLLLPLPLAFFASWRGHRYWRKCVLERNLMEQLLLLLLGIACCRCCCCCSCGWWCYSSWDCVFVVHCWWWLLWWWWWRCSWLLMAVVVSFLFVSRWSRRCADVLWNWCVASWRGCVKICRVSRVCSVLVLRFNCCPHFNWNNKRDHIKNSHVVFCQSTSRFTPLRRFLWSLEFCVRQAVECTKIFLQLRSRLALLSWSTCPLKECISHQGQLRKSLTFSNSDTRNFQFYSRDDDTRLLQHLSATFVSLMNEGMRNQTNGHKREL